MPSRQLILFKPADADDPAAGMDPLGSPRRVTSELEPFNTAPDGSKGAALGSTTLYGPGLAIDLPTSADEVMQLLVRVDDEESAWLVLARLCQSMGWKMMEPETGQTFM
ncbi:MAG: hypothetical protein AAGF47_01965 [Planctomycetota bacterium]